MIDGINYEELENMLMGTYFNKQVSGLRLREFNEETGLSKKFQVVATFRQDSTT